MDGRAQTGIVGLRAHRRLRAGRHPEAREDPAGQGGRPHAARPDAPRPTRSRCSSPTAGRPEIDALTGARSLETAPLYDFTAPDGVRHTVWRVAGRRARSWTPSARCRTPTSPTDTTARRAPGARAASSGTHPAQHRGDGEYNWFLAVLFPAEQLRILPYNRVVRDLGGLGAGGACSPGSRDVGPWSRHRRARAAQAGRVLLLPRQRVVSARARRRTTIDRTDPIGSLDVSLLQDRVLGPILGIGDPRTDKRIDFVGGIRGTAELERRVRSGEMAIAFSLYPTTPGAAHGGLGRGPDHAAQEHVVRAQAAKRALRAYFVGSLDTGRSVRRMKVLIADKFEKVGIDGLKELGCTVVSQPDVKADELPAAIRAADPHILIVRGKKVSADALKAGHRAHAGDPRRRGHRHHRRRHRVEPRRLRLQLSGQELDRGGGAGDGPAARVRPAHPRPGQPTSARAPGTRGSTPRRAGCTAGRSASWDWGRSGGRSRRGRRRSACGSSAGRGASRTRRPTGSA